MPLTPAQSESAGQLSRSFSGEIISGGAPGYDAARALHNGLADRKPLLIARCMGTADVVDAVKLGRDLELEIAVRGGGHNVSGNGSVNGGLMIDLSPMQGISVDPASRTARAQGGATWKVFNRETQLHGLATTGGVVSSTGVGGLTLGGGLGWLMPKYGMALDNLLAAEVVTAEGKILRASADSHPDLFWAIRGGGGNFGVVTNFLFQLHEVGPVVYGGLLAHPFEKARDVLRFFREQCASLPDEVMAFCGLVHAPDGSGAKLAALVVCHCGTLAEGEKALKPFKSFGSPVVDAVGPIPYVALNGMLDDGFPKGALNYWKSSFLNSLGDDAIDALVDAFANAPSPMTSLLLEHFHGAVCRVPETATAYPHRTESFNLAVLGQWQREADTGRCRDWVRKTYESVRSSMAPRRYVNYMGDDETEADMSSAYGVNLARLRKIKSVYDPSNVFHLNQNIRPG